MEINFVAQSDQSFAEASSRSLKDPTTPLATAFNNSTDEVLMAEVTAAERAEYEKQRNLNEKEKRMAALASTDIARSVSRPRKDIHPNFLGSTSIGSHVVQRRKNRYDDDGTDTSCCNNTEGSPMLTQPRLPPAPSADIIASVLPLDEMMIEGQTIGGKLSPKPSGMAKQLSRSFSEKQLTTHSQQSPHKSFDQTASSQSAPGLTPSVMKHTPLTAVHNAESTNMDVSDNGHNASLLPNAFRDDSTGSDASHEGSPKKEAVAPPVVDHTTLVSGFGNSASILIIAPPAATEHDKSFSSPPPNYALHSLSPDDVSALRQSRYHDPCRVLSDEDDEVWKCVAGVNANNRNETGRRLSPQHLAIARAEGTPISVHSFTSPSSDTNKTRLSIGLKTPLPHTHQQTTATHSVNSRVGGTTDTSTTPSAYSHSASYPSTVVCVTVPIVQAAEIAAEPQEITEEVSVVPPAITNETSTRSIGFEFDPARKSQTSATSPSEQLAQTVKESTFNNPFAFGADFGDIVNDEMFPRFACEEDTCSTKFEATYVSTQPDPSLSPTPPLASRSRSMSLRQGRLLYEQAARERGEDLNAPTPTTAKVREVVAQVRRLSGIGNSALGLPAEKMLALEANSGPVRKEISFKVGENSVVKNRTRNNQSKDSLFMERDSACTTPQKSLNGSFSSSKKYLEVQSQDGDMYNVDATGELFGKSVRSISNSRATSPSATPSPSYLQHSNAPPRSLSSSTLPVYAGGHPGQIGRAFNRAPSIGATPPLHGLPSPSRRGSLTPGGGIDISLNINGKPTVPDMLINDADSNAANNTGSGLESYYTSSASTIDTGAVGWAAVPTPFGTERSPTPRPPESQASEHRHHPRHRRTRPRRKSLKDNIEDLLGVVSREGSKALTDASDAINTFANDVAASGITYFGLDGQPHPSKRDRRDSACSPGGVLFGAKPPATTVLPPVTATKQGALSRKGSTIAGGAILPQVNPRQSFSIEDDSGALPSQLANGNKQETRDIKTEANESVPHLPPVLTTKAAHSPPRTAYEIDKGLKKAMKGKEVGIPSIGRLLVEFNEATAKFCQLHLSICGQPFPNVTGLGLAAACRPTSTRNPGLLTCPTAFGITAPLCAVHDYQLKDWEVAYKALMATRQNIVGKIVLALAESSKSSKTSSKSGSGSLLQLPPALIGPVASVIDRCVSEGDSLFAPVTIAPMSEQAASACFDSYKSSSNYVPSNDKGDSAAFHNPLAQVDGSMGSPLEIDGGMDRTTANALRYAKRDLSTRGTRPASSRVGSRPKTVPQLYSSSEEDDDEFGANAGFFGAIPPPYIHLKTAGAKIAAAANTVYRNTNAIRTLKVNIDLLSAVSVFSITTKAPNPLTSLRTTSAGSQASTSGPFFHDTAKASTSLIASMALEHDYLLSCCQNVSPRLLCFLLKIEEVRDSLTLEGVRRMIHLSVEAMRIAGNSATSATNLPLSKCGSDHLTGTNSSTAVADGISSTVNISAITPIAVLELFYVLVSAAPCVRVCIEEAKVLQPLWQLACEVALSDGLASDALGDISLLDEGDALQLYELRRNLRHLSTQLAGSTNGLRPLSAGSETSSNKTKPEDVLAAYLGDSPSDSAQLSQLMAKNAPANIAFALKDQSLELEDLQKKLIESVLLSKVVLVDLFGLSPSGGTSNASFGVAAQTPLSSSVLSTEGTFAVFVADEATFFMKACICRQHGLVKAMLKYAMAVDAKAKGGESPHRGSNMSMSQRLMFQAVRIAYKVPSQAQLHLVAKTAALTPIQIALISGDSKMMDLLAVSGCIPLAVVKRTLLHPVILHDQPANSSSSFSFKRNDGPPTAAAPQQHTTPSMVHNSFILAAKCAELSKHLVEPYIPTASLKDADESQPALAIEPRLFEQLQSISLKSARNEQVVKAIGAKQ